MKRTALLLATALIGMTGTVSAYDSDPGYGPDRPWMMEGSRELHREGNRWYGRGGDDYAPYNYGGDPGRLLVPLYYRPTMRFYGPGYTVSYRYVPVYKTDFPRSGAVGESSNFRTEGFHLSPAEVQAFGANLPRVTTKDEHSASPRTATTSIVRPKKPAAKTSRKSVPETNPGELPAIAPATNPAAAPDSAAPAPAPAPSAAPDAATPAPAGAPAKP